MLLVIVSSSFPVTAVMGQQTILSSPSAATTTLFQSITDSFSVQVPDGWIIQDIDNTGSTLLQERTQGYGILAQLCPEEQQQGGAAALSNASGGSTNSISSLNASRCLGAQEVIHIIRYPDLETRIQTANNITTYYLQKLQEVGYRGIQTVGSTDMTINITNPQTNQTTATVPAKFVEMTYSTNFVPNEIRTGYFILTATNSTAPNPGTTKGYSIFYEGSSAVAAEVITTTTSASSSLPPTPLSTAVAQVFGSFELIAAPGVVTEQAIVQTEQTEQAGGFGQVEQIECDTSYPGVCIPSPPPDFNCGDDGVPENFVVSGSDPHGFDADNDGIGCEDGNGDGDNGGGGGDDGDDNGGDTSCHPSYPDECIPPPPPNLNCDDVDATNFDVVPPDPHGFDGNDNDGIGCENGSNTPDEPEEEPGGGDDDDDGGDGGDDDDNGGSEEPEPGPGGGDNDDGDDNGGDDDEGEGGGGGEGNPNEFDDCIVPPGMDPGDVGC